MKMKSLQHTRTLTHTHTLVNLDSGTQATKLVVDLVDCISCGNMVILELMQ